MSLEIALGDLFDCIETVRTSAVRQENELMRLFLLRALRDRPSELVTGDGTGEPCPPFVAKGAQRSTDETDIPEACPGPHAVAATLRTPSTDLTEVDIKGRPYDPAIHSGSRGKCQDGTWKKRKNVPPEVTAAADAAWAAKCQAPKSFGSEDGMLFDANPVPPAPPRPVTPQVPAGWSLHGAEGVPVPPPPAPPLAPDFGALIAHLNTVMLSGKVDLTDIRGLCLTMGVQDLQGFKAQPALIPDMISAVDALAGRRE